MNYQDKDYTPEIIANATWKKCFNQANLERLLDYLIAKQPIPSQITIDRALAHLNFARTDGGSYAKDRKAALDAAQRNLNAAISETSAPPLTRAELDHFGSLSYAELQRMYWAEDGITTFRVRYDKAAQQHGYRIPARPTIVEVEEDDDSAMRLSASEYHSLPAQVVCKRLQSEPRFRRAVERLVSRGLIVILFGLLYGGLIQ